MSELVNAVDQFGMRRVELAAYVWAGRFYDPEEGCPALVISWRRALADVVSDAVTIHGVYGLYDLLDRVVEGVETPTVGGDLIDNGVAEWSRLMHALDVHSGAPSSFPLSVLSPRDLEDIAAKADEIDAGYRRVAAEVTARVALDRAA